VVTIQIELIPSTKFRNYGCTSYLFYTDFYFFITIFIFSELIISLHCQLSIINISLNLLLLSSMGHLCTNVMCTSILIGPYFTVVCNMVSCSLIPSLALTNLSLQFPSTFLITVFNILFLDKVLHARITFILLYKTGS
jgi:hypothetical protein